MKDLIELTFIICYRESETRDHFEDTTLTMIGDVNLFLKGVPNEEDFEAEVEIMIAGELIGIVCSVCACAVPNMSS